MVLAGTLGGPVDAQGMGRIGGPVRPAGFAVEHEIRRQMQQAGSFARRGLRQRRHRRVIDRSRRGRLVLRAIHRRVGCRIHDPIGFDLRERLPHGLGIDDVELRMRPHDDFMAARRRLHDRGADLPCRPAPAPSREFLDFGEVTCLAHPWPIVSATIPAGSGHSNAPDPHRPRPGSSHAPGCRHRCTCTKNPRYSEVTSIPCARPCGTHNIR